MSLRLRTCWPVALALVLAGCTGAVRWDERAGGAPSPGPPPRSATRAPAPESHVVQPGETLYAIATRYGLTTAQLAAWNRLGDGTLIRAGQRLALRPPAGGGPRAEPAAGAEPPPAWRRPVPGPVLAGFGDSPLTASGIQLGGRPGQPVLAAASGEVVYAGSGLKGYGELLIIKHGPAWLSAYGYNESLLVHEGERVVAGQAIARLGEGPAPDGGRRPALHFEIRRNGIPLDPAGQLPPAARGP